VQAWGLLKENKELNPTIEDPIVFNNPPATSEGKLRVRKFKFRPMVQ